MDWNSRFQRVAEGTNALRAPEDQEACIAVCRTCDHFVEVDHDRDGMPTCAKCTSCTTRIIRPSTRRWNCPLGLWPKKSLAPAPCAIGVVIPVRDEGIEILQTVRSMRVAPLDESTMHFWVIDDGSRDNCCDAVRGMPDVTVVRSSRNGEALGEGVCRNLGSEMAFHAGVDGVIVFDAHMRPMAPGGHEKLIATARATGGMVCGVTHPIIYSHYKKDFARFGGQLVWRTVDVPEKRLWAGLRTHWQMRHERIVQPVQAMLGASYCMTEETYKRIGGWMDVRGAYGFGEQALAIRGYMLGIPTHCRTDVHFQHKFRIGRPYRETDLAYWLNYTYCKRILFGEELFRRLLWPLAKAQCGACGEIMAALDEDVSDPRARWLARNPIHTPEETIEWLGIK